VGTDIRPLTEGSADLRYHASEDYQAHPIPPGTTTPMRVDLANLAEVLEPGHRLAVVISHGFWRGTTPELAPRITLHGDGTCKSSHLVVPVVTGGFGGQAPTLDYPPKPFLPPRSDDPARLPTNGCGTNEKPASPSGGNGGGGGHGGNAANANGAGDNGNGGTGATDGPEAAGGTEVAGESTGKPSPLAFTGANVLRIVALALTMIALGAALLRRRRA
ncbi:MAG: hypothetical protein LC808_34850, partial [Actinobacteria bacterium]|nr:hypothetical protein [Actinomycetota bacterium]